MRTDLFEDMDVSKKRLRLPRPKVALQRKLAVTVSFENIILLGISFIMSIVLFFSLGVERGKKVQLRNQQQRALRGLIASQIKKNISKQVAQQEQDKSIHVKDKRGKAKPSQQKPYTIQVVTYRKADLAKREMLKLRKNGYQPIIITKGDFLQICVGNFSTKGQASYSLKKLKRTYRDCFVRRM